METHQNNLSNEQLLQPSIQDFKPIKCIGKGGFSKVYLVRKKDTGLLYAMKTMKKNFILKERKMEQIMSERMILEKLNHPFLIKLKWAFQSKKELHLVMDFCPGGELFFHLRNIGKMTEEQAKFYFSEIVLGIEEIHRNNIVYRDLKPENVLLDLDGHIRLTDFGLSKENIRMHSKTYSFCGSPEYMSPEMLKGKGHGRIVDFYSLGALLYEMLTGLPPFYDVDRQIMYDRIENEEITFPQDLSHEAKSLLNELLNKDSTKRLGVLRGVDEIKDHPWLANMNFKELLKKKTRPPFIPNLRKSNFDPEYLNMSMDIEAVEEPQNNLNQSQINITCSFYQTDNNLAPIQNEEFEDYFHNFQYTDIAECRRSSYILQTTPRKEFESQINTIRINKEHPKSQSTQTGSSKSEISANLINNATRIPCEENTAEKELDFSNIRKLKEANESNFLQENSDYCSKVDDTKVEVHRIGLKIPGEEVISSKKIQPLKSKTIEVTKSLGFSSTANSSLTEVNKLKLEGNKLQRLQTENINETKTDSSFNSLSLRDNFHLNTQSNMGDYQDISSKDSEYNQSQNSARFQMKDYSETDSNESFTVSFLFQQNLSNSPNVLNLVAKIPAYFQTKSSKMKTQTVVKNSMRKTMPNIKNKQINGNKHITNTNTISSDNDSKKNPKKSTLKDQKTSSQQLKEKSSFTKRMFDQNVMRLIQREAIQTKKVQQLNSQRERSFAQKYKKQQVEALQIKADKDQLNMQAQVIKQFNHDNLMRQKQNSQEKVKKH